jgi:hypothetical protein
MRSPDNRTRRLARPTLYREFNLRKSSEICARWISSRRIERWGVSWGQPLYLLLREIRGQVSKKVEGRYICSCALFCLSELFDNGSPVPS